MREVWKILRPRLPETLGEAEWLAAINRHYIDHRHELAVVPGAVETIRRLAEMGLQQVCVSNSGRVIVDANLDAIAVTEHIAFSISLDDVLRGKPDPWPYSYACRRLGIAPSSVLAVEDSLSGIASAVAAGLPCAAVGFDSGKGYAGVSILGELVGMVSGK